MSSLLPPETRVGAVALKVADLERALTFYEKKIGFSRLEHDSAAKTAVLGVAGQPLLRLTGVPGARRVSGVTGLYHYAVRLPERADLARVLYQLAQGGVNIQGTADHGVSEAIYLSDPDRNGIEIYWDRADEDWPVTDDGQIDMYTDPLELDDLLSELAGMKEQPVGLPAGTVVGHVHLHVADLTASEDFYVNTLGLGLVQRYGGQAIFLAAGEYHHHVGANIWAGAGAPPPPADAAGLRYFELILPEEALQAALLRLRAAGQQPEPVEGGWLVRDPAQNGIVLKAG